MDKQSTGRKVTVQKRGAAPVVEEKSTDDRALKKSAFIVTMNTNITMSDDDAANAFAEQLAECIDELGYKGAPCSKWGHFFMVNPRLIPTSVYYNDDKRGMEEWCGVMESMEISGGGVEWSPGTKKNKKNQYLHAHILIKVKHRTRLMINPTAVAEYFQEECNLPHKPYVHVDYVSSNTQKILDYSTKNAWNKGSQYLVEAASQFFDDK